MPVKNAYPEKPIVPYFNKSVEMSALIAALNKTPLPLEVRRTAYVVIRNETGNGKSIVNGTNPAGVQSDGGRWPAKWDNAIVATCVKAENRTGKERGFVVFDTLENGIAFLCERLQARGLFVGGQTHKVTNLSITDTTTLATAYYVEWVTGIPKYKPTETEAANFVSMYKQSQKLIV